MTQVLTAACPNFIVQMSDRLVVAKQGAMIRDHDPVSNKTVVYRSADALVTIGYSGLAYIGRTPTDEWIAQTLHGSSLRAPGDDRPGIRLGDPAKPLRIGHAVKRLQDAIESLPGAVVDKYGLYLALAGWQGERRGARPIMVELSRINGKTIVDRAPRRWPPDRNFRIGRIGALPPDGAISTALAPHRTGGDGPPFLPETLECVLATVIRQTSAQNVTVGSHLLSVVLMRPDLGIAGCRFLPMTPHFAELTTGAGARFVLPVAHSPWVIGPGLVYPPSVEIGQSILTLGGLEFHIHGAPAPQSGLTALSSSLRRPPPPGRQT